MFEGVILLGKRGEITFDTRYKQMGDSCKSLRRDETKGIFSSCFVLETEFLNIIIDFELQTIIKVALFATRLAK